MLSDVVAEEVVRLRRAANLTRDDLADRCAQRGFPLSTATIANIETGRRDANGRRRRAVTVDELVVLADALDTEPTLLVFPMGRQRAATTKGATPRMDALPDLPAGVYRHYKGPLYLVLGYGHDANHEGRDVVVYIGLQLDGAKTGARLAVRSVEDFHAIVDPRTGEAMDLAKPTGRFVRRFTYIAPAWNPGIKP